MALATSCNPPKGWPLASVASLHQLARARFRAFCWPHKAYVQAKIQNDSFLYCIAGSAPNSDTLSHPHFAEAQVCIMQMFMHSYSAPSTWSLLKTEHMLQALTHNSTECPCNLHWKVHLTSLSRNACHSAEANSWLRLLALGAKEEGHDITVGVFRAFLLHARLCLLLPCALTSGAAGASLAHKRLSRREPGAM